jgi:hypothetical protein
LDLRGRKWQEVGEDYIMRSFETCTLHQILLGCSNQWVELVAHMGEMRKVHKILVRKPERKRPLRRPRQR